MPLRAVLLRLLLALTLVLDGIGSAAAGVRMAAAEAAPAAAAAHCHQAMSAAPADTPQPHRGCCRDGLCGCDGVVAATLAATVPFVPAALPEARATHRIATGHRPPVRAPTLRPPIGQAA